VENICSELRYLPDTRSLAQDHSLVLLCDLSHTSADAVEVAIVSGVPDRNIWIGPKHGIQCYRMYI